MTHSYATFLGEDVAADALASERARCVAAFVKARPELGATLTATKRHERGYDVLVMDVAADVPQRPVHPIRDVEPIAVVFGDDNQSPMVFALRQDFPQAPHTNDMPDGAPIALCLYRDGWSEVRLNWTPGTLVQKIRWWLEETAMGALYGEAHQIEPLFFAPNINLTVARDVFEECFAPGAEPGRLVARLAGDDVAQVWVLQRTTDQDPFLKSAPVVDVTFAEACTPVIADGRVRQAPGELSELIKMMSGLGFDLAAQLRAQLKALMGNEACQQNRFALMLAARLATPGDPFNQLLCFISSCTVEETAIALGEYAKAEDGGPAAYLLQNRDHSKIGEGIDITSANVAIAIDPREAAMLSGKPLDARKIALAGAGALGSALFDIYTRQGFGQWTTIDKDHLLTHNLARHALHRGLLGASKARGLASLSAAVLGEKHKASHLEADLADPGDKTDPLRTTLDEAELIIDATASAAAARVLAVDPAKARRASLFLLGDAKAIVVLIEDAERKARLDDLEATLVAHAIEDPRLAEQLAELPTQIATPASCRAPTSRAPWSRIVTLSGIAAEYLRLALDSTEAAIKVFRWRADDGIDAITIRAAGFTETMLGEWRVRVSNNLLADLRIRRIKALPSETGGVLIGATDAWNKVIHIAAHTSDFTDSVGTPVSFERGLEGMPDKLKHIATATHGALAYVGEWHSHPEGASAAPSGTDYIQLAGLANMLLIDDRPAVSLIVASDDERVLLGRHFQPSDAKHASA
ncbi:MAG: Mov34/MPN/PAD-1 family protein [Alphaproteobacteria bacterium]|nr:Mov34/MPN/PAD-1 family protein [Alphaproteobacteria bacterium]